MNVQVTIYKEQRADRVQHWLMLQNDSETYTGTVNISVRIEPFEYELLKNAGVEDETANNNTR